MSTTVYHLTANLSQDAGAENALAGVSKAGWYGNSSTTGTSGPITITGALAYNGQPFYRYMQSGNAVTDGALVVDVVYPHGFENPAFSFAIVYTMATGALT